MIIKFKKTDITAKMPARGSACAAGYDLFITDPELKLLPGRNCKGAYRNCCGDSKRVCRLGFCEKWNGNGIWIEASELRGSDRQRLSGGNHGATT